MIFFQRAFRYLLTVLFLAGCIFPAASVQARAAGGIAVSGSFYRHHFKLTPGESIASPDIDLVIYNNYDRDIEVALTGEAPAGVAFDLEATRLQIPAHSNVTRVIGLSVDETVVPGEYEIGIAADVIPQQKEGIAIVGSAQLRTKLSVYGEAGRVRISAKTRDGEPFAGQMHIFQVEDTELRPAGYTEAATLEDRLVPGKYMATLYWKGTEVATQVFSVTANESTELTLDVQTAFVQGVSATPQLDDQQAITSARIHYTLANIFEPLKDVRVALDVTYQGQPLEELEMFTLPSLETGSQASRYTYIPSQGWREGEYQFKVKVYAGQNVLQGESAAQSLTVGQNTGAAGGDLTAPLPIPWVAVAVLGVLLAAAGAFVLRKKHAG